MTWQLCVVGTVVAVAGPGFIIGVIIAVAPFFVVVVVARVVAVDARHRRCCVSFATWYSRAAGFSSANAKDGGGGVLTWGPADVPSGRVVWGRNGGGGGKEATWQQMAAGFRIWDDAGRWTESRHIKH